MSATESLTSAGISDIVNGLKGQDRIDLSPQVEKLGLEELEKLPTDLVVVTGFAEITSLGNTYETGIREMFGDTAIQVFPTVEDETRIAAHVDFNPEDHFSTHDLKRISPFSAMMQVIAREAASHAGILGEDGKLDPRFDRDRVGTSIGSGVGQAFNVINAQEFIESGQRLPTFEALRILPEQPNSRVASSLGLGGWGSNPTEACASGLSSIAEADLLIRSGQNSIMLAGGFEDVLSENPEVSIQSFEALTALSDKSDKPKEAMRPYDRDRDGFVMASGGGVLVLEGIESALKRGATIYATILGAGKSMDGDKSFTNLNPESVATVILKTLQAEGDEFYPVDAIFAHATATKAGDAGEINALRNVFGDELLDIPITAIKSMHGHLLGGAGAINAISAIRALHDGTIPPTINLDNREEQFEDLDIVTEARKADPRTALALAYGFGGLNAAVLFGKYHS